MDFIDRPVEGVLWQPLKKKHDPRGWLCELFRQDEIDPEYFPAMAYISMTLPGVARGPHEHRDQADYFCFLGPSNFKLFMWDNREGSPTFRTRQAVVVGIDNPQAVIESRPVGESTPRKLTTLYRSLMLSSESAFLPK